jgi:alpha-mannosidase
VQWHESFGEETEAVLTLPLSPKEVYRSNFLEENLEPVDFKQNEIRLVTGKFEVVTLKVCF